MTCSCCGEDRAVVTDLHCHPEVKVCRACIGWLRGQAGVLDVTPTLPVRDLDESIVFYEALGFDVRRYQGGGFGFVHHDDESVFDLDQTDVDPATNRAGCYVVVREVDRWHERVVFAGIAVTVVADREWGMREFEFRDPSNNNIRIGCPLGESA